MKIAEYQQMMDYLTGPRERFNGGGSVRNKTILPKKKPEEEVKKRKIKNFEKLRSVLENPEEVKKMIDKPKRGLVDEPGSYGGEGSGAKKGVSKPVKSFADQGIYTITEFAKLNNQPFTEQTLRSGIATKNKNIINGLKAAGIEILPKTKAGQATRLKMINSTKSMGKLVDYAMNLPKPPKSLSQPFYNEIPKAFNQLVKEGNPFSQADVAKKVLSNLKDNPYKPSQKAFEEVVGKNLTKAQKKKLTSGKITRALTETAPKRTVFEQVLEGNTNVKQLAKASGLSQKEVQKTAQNIVSGIYQAKKNIGLKQDIPDVILKDYGLNDYRKALDAIRDEPTLNVEYRKGIKDAVFEAYGNPNSKTYSKKKYERSLKRLDAFFEVRDKINKAFPDGRFNLQLDHPLSEGALRNLDNINPDQLVRVSPLTEEINLGLKKTFDERYQTILKNLKGEGGRRGTLDLDRKNLIKQKARIELLAKDLKIPLGKVSLTGKPVKFGTQEITKKNFAKEIKEGLQLKNKIVDNIKKIPNLTERVEEVFGKNKSRALDLLQNLEKSENVQDVLKYIGPLLRKGKGLRADASGVIDQISNAVFTPLQAAEVLPGEAQAAIPKPEEPMNFDTAESFPTKTEAGAGLAAATVGTKTGRDLFSKGFKGFDRYLLRPLTAIEAPTLALPQSLYQTYKLGSDIAKNQQTDVSAADITLPTSLSSAAASKKFGLDLFADNAGRMKKFLRGPLSPRAVSLLSRGSVYATPIIETGIQGYNAYKALKEADKKASVFEPRVDTALGEAPISYYNKIMSELPAVDRFGAAGGGIMKLAGKSSGPAPESGPTPQGLDFLIKRGR